MLVQVFKCAKLKMRFPVCPPPLPGTLQCDTFQCLLEAAYPKASNLLLIALPCPQLQLQFLRIKKHSPCA
jgi:hypothetical protein